MKFIDLSYFDYLKTEKDIINYVKEGLHYLEKNSKKETINAFTKIKKDYITKDSPLYANIMFSAPLYIDDENLYVDFVKNMISFNQKGKDKRIIDIDHFMLMCETFIIDTFLSDNKTDRCELHDKKEKLSIKDYYKNGTAKCFEKSATMHNLFKFLGIPSNLIIGECGLDKSDKGLHAYNIINDPKGNLWLVDFHNLIQVESKNGSNVSIPTLQKLDSKNVDNIETIIIDPKEVASNYPNFNFKSLPNNKQRLYIVPKVKKDSFTR